MEVLYEGWLIKSPPEKQTKRALLKAKWRRRYFVLHEPCAADSYPGVRATLRYYKAPPPAHRPHNQHDCLGTIDLTACETVDSSLRSDVYRNLFSLRTKHKGRDRTYYLAAPTEADMNNWVDCLCQLLGLKEKDDDDKPPEVSAPPANSTPTHSQPTSRHMLLPQHDTSLTSSLSSLQQPERPNSRQEGYFLLEDCYSDNPPPVPPPVSSSSHSALNKVPPAPPHPHLTGAIPHSASSHSIPDDAPPPPPKTGEGRSLSNPHTSQLYDCPPQQTYDNPKLNYINVDALDNEEKYPDSNDNVYKVPPPRVDTESLYKVPPVNHLKFVGGGSVGGGGGDSVYDCPPSSHALAQDVYDVPPPSKSVRDSNSSTDDSGIQSGEQSTAKITSRLAGTQITDDIYDQPPCMVKPVTPAASSSQDIYAHPPSCRSTKRLDIYDLPPSRPRDLNEVVPIPRSGRKMSEGSIPVGTSYINLQQHRSPHSPHALSGSGTVPRKHHHHHPTPPTHRHFPHLDDVYDFPRSSSLGGGGSGAGGGGLLGHNDLDAMPPAPQPHGPPGGVNIHRYVNATSAVVHPPSNQEEYMPMGASSKEQLNYMPMGGGSAASPKGQESYMPMGGKGAGNAVGCRASTDSNYTVMVASDEEEEIMAPIPPKIKDVNNELGITRTHRSKSFKREIESPQHTPLQLPTRKRTVADSESSSDEDDSDGSSDTLQHHPGRKPPAPAPGTSLLSKPPAPASTGEVQYLDLDLDIDSSAQQPPPVFARAPVTLTPAAAASTAWPAKNPPSETDYKEIDFVKTQALTEIRKDLENKRKSSEKSMDE